MTTNWKSLTAMLVALTWALVLPIHAAERKAYNAAEFAAAQQAGKSIVVDVTAPWCPTCRAQKPAIEKLGADPAFKDLIIFEIDFDTGRDALIVLKARSQSTLIAFKGEREMARSVGDTNPDSIAALFRSAL